MVTHVIKRNGKKAKFNKAKIECAVTKAFNGFEEINDSTKQFISKLAADVEGMNKAVVTVDEIHDFVEKKLMASSHKDVAKSYINYRYLKRLANNKYDELWSAIDEKLQARNVQNQNANMDEHSFSGRMGEAGDVVTKQYALDNIVSPMARANHENNEIYIHDLNAYSTGMHNCLSVPFDDLLKNGFTTRQVDIRPAGSVNTAMQLVAVIFQLQSLQQFGGVSATHIDWTMVPYVRKSFYKHYKDGMKYLHQEVLLEKYNNELSIMDDLYTKFGEVHNYACEMTRREIHQAVEALYHNLNSLQSRSGGQLPFTSINYGTCTLEEGRMITEELLNVSIEGLGSKHRTSIFPCGIFQYWDKVNGKPGTPNYDLYQLALKSTSLRLYPNYANISWSGNAGFDENDPKTYFSTMGCRTANGADINAETGVNPQTKDGRGNICPTTIIMPTLAMEAKELAKQNNTDIVSEFMTILDKKIGEAKDMLLERFEWICSQPADSATFMYENGTFIGYKPNEGIRSALRHGTLALGQIGLAETLQILISCDHTTEYGMQLAKKIEQLFKTKCAEFKKQYKLNFGVYYTPAENLCFTSMKKFKAKYGEIPNVSDKEFFTNSIHVPVWKNMDPFEKIDIESQLTGYSSAGCITYVELDASCKHNIEALEKIVNYAMEKDIPYFAINVPNDHCEDCGYTDEIGEKCPICGSSNISRLRRVTGYLTGDYKTAFNYGKQKEVEARVKHEKVICGDN